MGDRNEVKCVYSYVHVLAGTFFAIFSHALMENSTRSYFMWFIWFLATHL